jgi:hypothetical protein
VQLHRPFCLVSSFDILESPDRGQTGDRAGAARAYRRYLMLRIDPEPSKIGQRDSVRTELTSLEGQRN